MKNTRNVIETTGYKGTLKEGDVFYHCVLTVVHWGFGDKVFKLGRQPLKIVKNNNKVLLNNTKLY